MFERTKGIVYVRIPGHDKREPIDVDVERPLDDVRGALKSFLPFQFDGNFRLKDSHDVLDASKSLRDLGLDCGVGQYVELEYHHANHFPGLLGGGWTPEKRDLASKCDDAGIDWKAKGLSGQSGNALFRRLLAEAQGQQSGHTSSHSFPTVQAMASAIDASGIDRPSGRLIDLERGAFEKLYVEAQAELAKTKVRPRREATTEQSEETKEEDVEMKDVTHIKLGTKKGEGLLKAEVEKLLHEADEAWTCAKIKFHDAVVDLHAINATPARSMAWWCRSLAVFET